MTAPDGAAAGAAAARGAAIRIRVVRTGGTPVPGATLTVLDGDGGQVARGRGDAAGVFRAGVPRPGDYLLIAAAPGHEPQSATLVVPGPGEHAVDLTLPGRYGGLTGTVTGAAGPVHGATVVVHDERGEVVATTTTDAHGRYAVADLTPAVYAVVAVAPGMNPVTDSVSVGTSGEAFWDAGLASAQAGLHGVARTADGRPVPDARVALLNADGTSVDVADTDAEGRYAFPDLPPGDYTVVTTGYPPVADVLRIDAGGGHYDPVLGHPDVP